MHQVNVEIFHPKKKHKRQPRSGSRGWRNISSGDHEGLYTMSRQSFQQSLGYDYHTVKYTLCRSAVHLVWRGKSTPKENSKKQLFLYSAVERLKDPEVQIKPDIAGASNAKQRLNKSHNDVYTTRYVLQIRCCCLLLQTLRLPSTRGEVTSS